MHKQICNRDDSIEVLNLTIRVYNALRRRQIKTLGALVDIQKQDGLWTVRNLGEKGIAQIESKLEGIDVIDHFSEQKFDSSPKIGYLYSPVLRWVGFS